VEHVAWEDKKRIHNRSFIKPHESTKLTFEEGKKNILANTLFILGLFYFPPRTIGKCLPYSRVYKPHLDF
jgi:hypothetical protein